MSSSEVERESVTVILQMTKEGQRQIDEYLQPMFKKQLTPFEKASTLGELIKIEEIIKENQ